MVAIRPSLYKTQNMSSTENNTSTSTDSVAGRCIVRAGFGMRSLSELEIWAPNPIANLSPSSTVQNASKTFDHRPLGDVLDPGGVARCEEAARP